jgi:hypothetical protein
MRRTATRPYAGPLPTRKVAPASLVDRLEQAEHAERELFAVVTALVAERNDGRDATWHRLLQRQRQISGQLRQLGGRACLSCDPLLTEYLRQEPYGLVRRHYIERDRT